MNGNNVTHFDSFRVEYIPQGIKKNVYTAKPSEQVFIEYKYMIQQCNNTFALDLLI